MPTHFHLLIKQKKSKGISRFLSNVLNSFTRTYNTYHRRKGPLFLPQSKGVKITSRQQLLHTSRYIHLNPYSSNITTSIDELLKYPWSSITEYLSNENDKMSNKLTNSKHILRLFENNRDQYIKFIVDNADYQRKLEYIKSREKLFRLLR